MRQRDWLLCADASLDWLGIRDTAFPGLIREGWRVECDENGRIETARDTEWYSELEAAGDGWFDFRVGICVHGTRVDLLPVVHRLLAENRGRRMDEIRCLLENRQIPVSLGQSGFALVSGARLLLIIQELLELSETPAGDELTTVRLDVWRAAEIAQLEKFAASPWNRPADLCSLAKRLERGRSLLPMAAPRSLRTRLRPYQRLGLSWLQFVREAGFGGILADDMGLGKTVQTLAHLLVEKKAGRLTRPCLVVSPTSVMQNWVDETRRFAPSLKTLVLHGSDRHGEFDKVRDAEVVFTTYPLLRRDAARFQKHDFSTVILDEAQHIKNHRALTAQVAGSLKSDWRLCLTGTPMENHLGELWSLFHFLMPGFLGTEEAFRRRFRDPIEREGDSRARLFLARRVGPFLLRRRKVEVEKDLPAKTIMTQNVELTDRQQEMYESVRLAMQARIQDEIQARGLDRSRITILAALLRLRQICCDPRLAKTRAGQDATAADSAKLQALMEMMPEMLEEGRRILLFSQFVGMLTLIEAELKTRAIPYALLTGTTKDRPTQVRRFQEGEVGVFLISLKAGGTGLNLTAADTVIHYDPWWNPAVENQATDRAHRIGQDKPVFVYRLVAAGTVEARIHAMQEGKQKLADGILQEQKADSIRFSMDDLTSLFAPIDDGRPGA